MNARRQRLQVCSAENRSSPVTSTTSPVRSAASSPRSGPQPGSSMPAAGWSTRRAVRPSGRSRSLSFISAPPGRRPLRLPGRHFFFFWRSRW
ncbi:hypothetical protein EG831_09595 [bacterium]|nr:hypothetical protein [bacterium]